MGLLFTLSLGTYHKAVSLNFKAMFCGRKKSQRVPSDDVLPAWFFDDSPMMRDVVMRLLIRFDDILDPDKLHSSLDTLLEYAHLERARRKTATKCK